MTTYTLSGTYIDWDDDAEYGADSYANNVEISVVAADSYFTYEYDTDPDNTFGILGVYVPVYNIIFDGVTYASDALDVGILQATWGNGNVSTVLLFAASEDEFGNYAFDGEYIVVVEGDALPVFTSLADVYDFDSSITGADFASGVWGAGSQIVFEDMSTFVSSTEYDVIDGTADADWLAAGAGEDDIYGNAGDDALFGQGGDDYLDGGAGADTINGGVGYDQVNYRGNPSAVYVDLRAGYAVDGYGDTDELISIESVRGSMFDDTIYGDAGDNMFRGLAGDDTIDGRAGIDTVRYDRDARYGGTAGVVVDLENGVAVDGFGDVDTLIRIENARGTDTDDTILGSSAKNVLQGEGGNDWIEGGANSDTIDGGAGRDKLFGGTGHDVITGAGGNDRLLGEGGNDTLDGGVGNDVLVGGAGNDELTGGVGADKFVFKGNFGADVVTDFVVGTDLVVLSKAVFTDEADAYAHLSDGLLGAVLDDGLGHTVTFVGVFTADMSASDFLV